jgi:hypothetical protein
MIRLWRDKLALFGGNLSPFEEEKFMSVEQRFGEGGSPIFFSFIRLFGKGMFKVGGFPI